MDGDDELQGGSGRDYIEGGANNDKIYGGDNDDTLLGGTGNDNLYGGAGNDHLNGQAGADNFWGGENDDVLIAIDTVLSEYLDGGTGADTMWIDGQTLPMLWSFSDNVVGATSADVIQRVSSFANGADKTLDGDNIADPTDSGLKVRFNNTITADNTQGTKPLFAQSTIPMSSGLGAVVYVGGGPKSSDIVQSGSISDCWLLAGLGSIANKNPNTIRQNVVDFDDGTYGVRLGNSFYRVDNELRVWSIGIGETTSGNLRQAKLGAQNSMWVAIVEKAFASYRTGANTYASLSMGTPTEAFSAFRLKNVTTKYLDDYKGSAASMATELYSKWSQGYAVAIGSMAMVGGGNHEFTVERFILNAAGTVTNIVVRNPWGYDGLASFVTLSGGDVGTTENDGVFTLTVDQLVNARGWVYWGQA
jgi:hypothetical protein